MEWWQWLIAVGWPVVVAALVKLYPIALGLLKGRAADSRKNRLQTEEEWARLVTVLQTTVGELRAENGHLHDRLEVNERHIGECEARAKGQAQEITLLKDNVSHIKDDLAAALALLEGRDKP